MRKAKIVCTIGPATNSATMLDRLIEHGMDVARLNFSHGTHESHTAAIQAIRQAADRRQTAVAIIQDLQGPRIRIGDLADGPIELTAGQSVLLTTMFAQSGGQLGARSQMTAPVQTIPVSYPYLARDVKSGARILINDGLVELTVDRITGGAVECTVHTGGSVASHKGINLPDTAISAPTLTDKDRNDIHFGIAHGVDYFALSFVRNADDIRAARQWITDGGGDQPIIAKIERGEAIASLNDILEQADGVMIARGDLGVELGPESVPVLQKRIIVEANRRHRLVITATQMLESMTHALRPTRAEASDVANAIFDGTDAVMLSSETAVGAYPIEAVHVMDRIIRAAEEGVEPGVTLQQESQRENLSIPEAICTAAASAATTTGASAIVAFSEQGTTARLIGKRRPKAPIIAFTPFESVKRRMALYWGVRPFTMPQIEQTDARMDTAVHRLKAEQFLKSGERIVILSGTLAGRPGGTNLVKLHGVD